MVLRCFFKLNPADYLPDPGTSPIALMANKDKGTDKSLGAHRLHEEVSPQARGPTK